jgi:predicted HTH transcriptional regulator
VRKVQALSRFDEKPFPMLIELTDHGYVSHGKARPIATERASALVLDVAPTLKKNAMTLKELVDATGKSRATVQRAIDALLSQHKIGKLGRGSKNSPFRFWQHDTTSVVTGK